MIHIDGSALEGGGQILRIALACSALTGIPIRISKIRAGRAKGGLAAQHLQGVLLLRDICNAKVSGAIFGSTEVEFSPGRLKGGKYFADTKSAGSVALLLQVALPVALFCNGTVELQLKGGTNAEMAPQIDFITEIFRPNLERFNATFDFDLLKRGYFPKGGGHCVTTLRPVHHLDAVELLDFGTVNTIFGWSFVAGGLPIHLAEQFANAARTKLQRIPSINRSNINIEVYEENQDVAAIGNKCGGIILGCKTTTGCILGGSGLNGRQMTPEMVGEKAANELTTMIEKHVCVDEHVQDQLIIFMALAKGTSKIRMSSPLTLHTQTAIYVVELITKVSFKICNSDDAGQSCIVECCGIGLENKNI